IRVRVGEIRRSSWAFDYAFDRADGLRCAEARTIQVMLDQATKRPVRIPPAIREVLERARPAGPAVSATRGWDR
ncbi:MAG TPA: hypothetical protein VM070_05640, partial [Candidatus Saccharimonadales bacterium]|nr:hypothetical protein [Candidatus Saccharimonadales bacterium]